MYNIIIGHQIYKAPQSLMNPKRGAQQSKQVQVHTTVQFSF